MEQPDHGPGRYLKKTIDIFAYGTPYGTPDVEIVGALWDLANKGGYKS